MGFSEHIFQKHSRHPKPSSKYIYWPSCMVGMVLYIIPPNPDIKRFTTSFQCINDWTWYIDYQNYTYSYGCKSTENKAINKALKLLAAQLSVSLQTLNELMTEERLLHCISSIGD